MLRFVAILWDCSIHNHEDVTREFSAHFRRSRAGWDLAFDTPGLRIYLAGERRDVRERHLLEGQRGIVLGSLFSRQDSQSELPVSSIADIDSGSSSAIVRTNGRHLIGRYWGSYVAFFHQDSGKVSVVRSPIGHLPCLMATAKGVNILFSYFPDFQPLAEYAFSLNWRFITQYLISKLVLTGETGLNEVKELRGGERIEFGHSNVKTSFVWNPFEIAMSDQLEDPDRATVILRNTLKSSVRSLIGEHQKVIHYLSGGLDSSIVLACLQDAPSALKPVCVNYYSPGSDSDEREFARLSARRAGCEFLEIPRHSDINLAESVGMPASERPQPYYARLQLSRVEEELTASRGATAVFSGERGDELFYKAAHELAAADYVSRHGIGAGFVRAVLNAAELEELSVWRVGRDALYNGLVSRHWDSVSMLSQYHTLIRPDAIDSLKWNDLFPWGPLPGRVPAGKQQHTLGLANPLPYYYPSNNLDGPTQIWPLASQPVTEACLRIPTYVLSSHGRDRVIARRAFAGDVPNEIIYRQSKGGMDEHVAGIFRRNLDFLRPLLLEGSLVNRGILDQQKVAEALSGRPSNRMKGLTKILHYAAIETWIAIISRQYMRAAA